MTKRSRNSDSPTITWLGGEVWVPRAWRSREDDDDAGEAGHHQHRRRDEGQRRQGDQGLDGQRIGRGAPRAGRAGGAGSPAACQAAPAGRRRRIRAASLNHGCAAGNLFEPLGEGPVPMAGGLPGTALPWAGCAGADLTGDDADHQPGFADFDQHDALLRTEGDAADHLHAALAGTPAGNAPGQPGRGDEQRDDQSEGRHGLGMKTPDGTPGEGGFASAAKGRAVAAKGG